MDTAAVSGGGEGAGLEGVGPAAVGGDDGGAEFDRQGQVESAFGG